MLNCVTLMGRLVAEPELRHTPSDVAVTSFTIAVDRSYTKSGTERKTDFIDIVAWRQTAEFISKYFHKGQLIAVKGSIQTGTYEKDGVRRKIFEILAENVYFAEPKKNSEVPSPPRYDERTQEVNSFSSGSDDAFEEIVGDDDDLPF